MQLSSSAFAQGQTIPKKHSEDGENLSPPLSWTGAPPSTGSYALIVEDPDAPTADPWIHWVMFNIPGDTTSLPAGLPRNGELTSPIPARQGRNSFKNSNVGYRGPAPPHGDGAHHYYFRIFALDRPLDLAPEVSAEQLRAAMKTVQVLSTGELVGVYQR